MLDTNGLGGMTDFPILYSFRRCPYAMRARMAVAASGVSVELREVVLRDKPPEMLEISPKGTVPVLVLPDGGVIEESLDIMHWALGQNDPENWLADVDADLIAANDGPFKQALAELVVDKLAPIAMETRRLLDDPATVDGILRQGAERAAALADPIVAEAERLVGFLRAYTDRPKD